jgi:hypothetical protein
MAVTTPDWLAQRGGELRPGKDGRSWSVHLRSEPLYLLQVVPAAGKHACRVAQTVNGKRLDRGGVYPTIEDAARGGLEDLRTALGW